MTIEVPDLPGKDVWEVGTVAYDGNKIMLVSWKRHTDHGSYRVASKTFKPGDEMAFVKTYQKGLRRLERDELEDSRKASEKAALDIINQAAVEHNKKKL